MDSLARFVYRKCNCVCTVLASKFAKLVYQSFLKPGIAPDYWDQQWPHSCQIAKCIDFKIFECFFPGLKGAKQLNTVAKLDI